MSDQQALFWLDAMEEDEGPVAERDFPEGCVRYPRNPKNPKNLLRPRPAGGSRAEGGGESPRLRLVENFDSLNPRDQFLERRRLYSDLTEHYKEVKKHGELIGTRPDLQAMKDMNEQGASLVYQEPGPIPGVEVGDRFDFRTEVFVVGLHRQVQGGIAWVEVDSEKVACSVVVSGGYHDDVDHGEIIEFTGQGGNNYRGDRRQVEDQKPERGNEALIRSHDLKTPVRVIRGRDVGTPWNKIYSYDGLYNVFDHEISVGIDGHKVYIFKLKRVPEPSPIRD